MKLYLFLLFGVLFFSCTDNTNQTPTDSIQDYDESIDTDVLLGAKLFFDPILSQDRSISCASCHNPAFAFADSSALSLGVGGKLGVRNTPSVMNMSDRPFFFHDGRALTLQEQAMGPIENPLEMNLNYAEAVKRVRNEQDYVYYFNKIYNSAPDSITILEALAAFQNSLESDGSAPHDLWMNDIDSNALTSSQLRGRELFLTKANCFDCHFGPDFTGDEFRNIGIYDGLKFLDEGRFEVTRDPADLGKFKVPGLRNIALSAPYMHNGMFRTLEEVIEYYDNPYLVIEKPLNMDSLMLKPLNLTQQEKEDLVAFMHSLTDSEIPYAISKK